MSTTQFIGTVMGIAGWVLGVINLGYIRYHIVKGNSMSESIPETPNAGLVAMGLAAPAPAPAPAVPETVQAAPVESAPESLVQTIETDVSKAVTAVKALPDVPSMEAALATFAQVRDALKNL